LKFSYKAYSELIEQLKSKGYNISSYHNYLTNDKVAILRHDVDLSVEKALLMAELEQSLGVSATYFFLLSTDFYNIASENTHTKIKQIQNMGHEIGLHFDEIKYQNSNDTKDILLHLFNEVKVMELILGTTIRAVSMHRPSAITLEANYSLGDIVNSYSKVFFHEFKYVSDSRRLWREDVVNIINSGEFNKLHILTHPFWYNNKELTAKESLSEYIKKASMERYYGVKDNISDIEEFFCINETII